VTGHHDAGRATRPSRRCAPTRASPPSGDGADRQRAARSRKAMAVGPTTTSETGRL
jgi:hypothetical protein